MDKNELNTTIAIRRAALFNIKVRNQNIKNLLNNDYKKQKELEIERDKLSIIFKTKIGIKDVDKYLLSIKGEKNENKKQIL